jgi:hypothetical protein
MNNFGPVIRARQISNFKKINQNPLDIVDSNYNFLVSKINSKFNDSLNSTSSMFGK